MSDQNATKDSEQGGGVWESNSCYGIDVSKDKLDIWDGDKAIEIKSSKAAIKGWLKGIPAQSRIAMEATGSYHQALAELAFGSGHQVYVINPRIIKKYRECQSTRFKNDVTDARLIARYLEKESDQLHPYTPPSHMAEQIKALLSYRKTLSQSLTRLRQNQRSTQPHLAGSLGQGRAAEALQQDIKDVDNELKRLLGDVDEDNFKRLLEIKSVGLLTSAWLCQLFGDHQFKSADAAVKFVGMDLIFQDSGQKVGRRLISKRGDAEFRRVIYCAASSARYTAEWGGVYQYYLERGFNHIQATCILARKILRTAWAIYYQGVSFDPQRINGQMT